MKPVMTQERQKKSQAALKEAFGYKNVMQIPKVTKVVVGVGVGSVSDKKRKELIFDRLSLITGQKPAERAAKKAIATFKSRKGDIIGYQVTLRGARMWGFLDKLIHIALPRTRDFRGLKANAFDDMGNYSLGIKEHTVFPETGDEDVKDVFGLGITVVTTAKTKEEATALLTHLGFPFAK
jgi:large subunit ribosomal protein L5